MGLPVNIEDVLQGRSVEWERLEFKQGLNREAVLHTLCAFANDFHNLGGGYVFIGIAEENGRPVLPPQGLEFSQMDALQKKIAELGHHIQPSYLPQIEPCLIEGRYVLVLHAPGGSNRPYNAPVSLARNDKRRAYYLRHGSTTTEARDHQLRELFELAANVPFDDRVCHGATMQDLKLGLIRAHLQEIGSDLYVQSETMRVADLARRMTIIEGPNEAVQPRNVGLMFFNEEPEKFFPLSQIDVVVFPDGAGGDELIEKSFRGPLGRQLRDALDYIQKTIIKETIIKRPNRAEADRFSNYPYAAIEEILGNAVYHRSYELREPIEVRIMPESLTITSYPGPDRSIQLQDLQSGNVIARRYRNRRIGDFLKELRLTEGRSTGIPKVFRAMQANGSPPPTFNFDADRTYFTTTLPVHPAFIEQKGGKEGGKKPPVSTPHVNGRGRALKVVSLLEFCRTPRNRVAIRQHLQLKNAKDVRERFLNPLLGEGLLTLTNPRHPASHQQQYQTTQSGLKYLQSLAQHPLFQE